MRSVCVILQGLRASNRILQPWRYVTEVAVQLSRQGHPVTLLSESRTGAAGLDELDGVPVRNLRSVLRLWWRGNPELDQAISAIDPDVVLWNVGLTSFIHQGYPRRQGCAQIAIFSSPMYTGKEIARIGMRKLMADRALSGIHILAAFSPRWLLRQGTRRSQLDLLVTQTETTRAALATRFWSGPVRVIPPGVDELWLSRGESAQAVRAQFGYTPDDFVVLYYGSPAPLRGLPLLIRAFALARKMQPELKLLILARDRENGLAGAAVLNRDLEQLSLADGVRVVREFLAPASLKELVSASDVVALPFELIPSDAPLSVLEVLALGKPLITSRLACLPELVQGYPAFLVEPGSVACLSRAILQARQEQEERGHQARLVASPQPARAWEDVGDEWSRLVEAL